MICTANLLTVNIGTKQREKSAQLAIVIYPKDFPLAKSQTMQTKSLHGLFLLPAR